MSLADDFWGMTQLQADTLRDDALRLMVHVTSGHATVADLRELEEWRKRNAAHEEAYARAFVIWEALRTAAGESMTAQDRAMIAGRIDAGRHAVSRRALIGGALAASAASAAYLMIRPPLGLWPSLSDLLADYRTDVGERRTVSLGEGVSVEMNTRTAIAHHAADGDGNRVELLSGEAAFRTGPGTLEPVTVVADEGYVTVSSPTQFNLRYDLAAVQVTCLDGALNVKCRDDEATLRSGEQLTYASGRGMGAIVTIDLVTITAWQQGLLIFHDEPLARVLDEVNRYWRGRIILLNRDLGRRRVTVRVETARISEIISYVHSVMNASVRTLPGGVVLLT
jgi:transmembrane sensor